MTTAETYRVQAGQPATTERTPALLGMIDDIPRAVESFRLVVETTASRAENRRLRRELAARSLAADSGLDRHLLLSDEIHQHAWGISGE